MTLDCPNCFTPMHVKMLEAVEIDICPKCAGTWLDPGELKKLIKDKEISDYLTKEIGTKSESKLVCPRCGSLMDIEKAEDVEVDVCLDCKGVFLDAGEMAELKDISEKGFEPDELAKAEERWEELIKKRKSSKWSRLFGK